LAAGEEAKNQRDYFFFFKNLEGFRFGFSSPNQMLACKPNRTQFKKRRNRRRGNRENFMDKD
jgi:hypothetical protein